MDLAHPTWLAAYAAMLAAAAGWDAAQRRIPNAVVFAGAAVALGVASTPSGIGTATALAGLAAGLAIGFPLYLLRVLGAGDAKLVAAVGAFVGFPRVFAVVLLAMLAGGVIAFGWALARGRLRAVFANLGAGMRTSLVLGASQRRMPRAEDIPASPERIPYAVAVAAGAVAQLAMSGGFDWTKGF